MTLAVGRLTTAACTSFKQVSVKDKAKPQVMLWLRDKSKPRLGLLKPYPGQLFYPCNVD